MPLNRDYIGRTFAAAEPYVVSRVKVREFAEAVGDPNPVYHSLDAARAVGSPDLVVPPTFAIALSAAEADNPIFEPGFGMRYGRVVHGEQEFDYARPIRIGDELAVEAEIIDVTDAGRNEVVKIATRVRSAAGELVCTSTNSLVSRGTAMRKEEE